MAPSLGGEFGKIGSGDEAGIDAARTAMLHVDGSLPLPGQGLATPFFSARNKPHLECARAFELIVCVFSSISHPQV